MCVITILFYQINFEASRSFEWNLKRRKGSASSLGCYQNPYCKLSLGHTRFDEAQNVHELMWILYQTSQNTQWKLHSYVFLFNQFKIYFLISIYPCVLIHGLFGSILLNLKIYGGFPVIFFLLIYNLMPVGVREYFLDNFNPLHFLDMFLWSSILSKLVNIKCVFEENVYFAFIKCYFSLQVF